MRSSITKSLSAGAVIVATPGAAVGLPSIVQDGVPFRTQNAQREQLADKLANEVRRDAAQNLHISTDFANFEKQDERDWRHVQSNRNMKAFLQRSKKLPSDDGTRGSSSKLSFSGNNALMKDLEDFSFSSGSDSVGTTGREDNASSSKATDDSASSSVFSSGEDAMARYMREFHVDTEKVGRSESYATPQHRTNSGGQVISIPLSSQLQISATLGGAK
ncbi:unnamed protein product [Amoebophrya sp. A25]|nr:unnamed protein product [Amoebophrya sp. A25]|eukprot:GSA25T00018136001.1